MSLRKRVKRKFTLKRNPLYSLTVKERKKKNFYLYLNFKFSCCRERKYIPSYPIFFPTLNRSNWPSGPCLTQKKGHTYIHTHIFTHIHTKDRSTKHQVKQEAGWGEINNRIMGRQELTNRMHAMNRRSDHLDQNELVSNSSQVEKTKVMRKRNISFSIRSFPWPVPDHGSRRIFLFLLSFSFFSLSPLSLLLHQMVKGL